MSCVEDMCIIYPNSPPRIDTPCTLTYKYGQSRDCQGPCVKRGKDKLTSQSSLFTVTGPSVISTPLCLVHSTWL